MTLPIFYVEGPQQRLVQAPLIARPVPCTYVVVYRVGNLRFLGRIHLPHHIAYPQEGTEQT